jgi:hypothetical protein
MKVMARWRYDTCTLYRHYSIRPTMLANYNLRGMWHRMIPVLFFARVRFHEAQ